MINFFVLNPTLFFSIVGVIIFFFMGIRIVRPTQRALIERLGKYNRFASPGFHWIIPIIESMYFENVTELMVDASCWQ